MAEEKKKVPEFMHGLLGDEADGEDAGDEGVDDAHDMHPGKVASMAEFSSAHESGDHEGMARALENFHDIHTKSEKTPKKGRDPKADEGED